MKRWETPERKAYMKAWHAANPRDRREYKKAYDAANRERNIAKWAENRERHKARAAAYYRAHRDEIRARVKAYTEENKDRVIAYQSAYWKANNDRKVHIANRRRLRKLTNGGSHTLAERQEKFARLGNVCYYCGDAKRLTVDHDIPLVRGGTDDISNILPACKSCNSRKRTLTAEEFIRSSRRSVA